MYKIPTTRAELMDRLVEILVTQLGVDKEHVTPEAKLDDDLGADSLDTVELTIAFEEEFELEIPDEDMERYEGRDATVQTVADYLAERLSLNAQPETPQ